MIPEMTGTLKTLDIILMIKLRRERQNTSMALSKSLDLGQNSKLL